MEDFVTLSSQNLGVFPHIRESIFIRVEVLPCFRCMHCVSWLHVGERPRAAEIFVFGEVSIILLIKFECDCILSFDRKLHYLNIYHKVKVVSYTCDQDIIIPRVPHKVWFYSKGLTPCCWELVNYPAICYAEKLENSINIVDKQFLNFLLTTSHCR